MDILICQHEGCANKASRMVGYTKWCGSKVNVQAVCQEHVSDAEQAVNRIMAGHASSFAQPYNVPLKYDTPREV